jgi:hypothetical protein
LDYNHEFHRYRKPKDETEVGRLLINRRFQPYPDKDRQPGGKTIHRLIGGLNMKLVIRILINAAALWLSDAPANINLTTNIGGS